MVDPDGIANWSITHVDWSERKWHPKSYKAHDITKELLKNITVWFYLIREICSHGTSVHFLRNSMEMNWILQWNISYKNIPLEIQFSSPIKNAPPVHPAICNYVIWCWSTPSSSQNCFFKFEKRKKGIEYRYFLIHCCFKLKRLIVPVHMPR